LARGAARLEARRDAPSPEWLAHHRAALRGSGEARFRSTDVLRDGRAVALAADAIDLLDALGLDRVQVVGHDWGARVAYTLGALAPDRLGSIVTLALPCEPRGAFTIPPFGQAPAFWYQWLMCLDAGALAVVADPIAFARIQWNTWSPPAGSTRMSSARRPGASRTRIGSRSP
jgi:pimeloyl-ACP methyl ester carboxylesterase